jgi:hypothetical protein
VEAETSKVGAKKVGRTVRILAAATGPETVDYRGSEEGGVMSQRDNNSGSLDSTALAGVRRLASAFTGGEEKPDATKVAVMFMVTGLLPPDSTGSAGFRLIPPETITQSIDMLQSLNTFVSEMVQALQAIRDMKPPFPQG